MLYDALEQMYYLGMTEKQVTLDSLSVDAVFADGPLAVRKFDNDVDVLVKKISKETILLIDEAFDTLLAARALARRVDATGR